MVSDQVVAGHALGPRLRCPPPFRTYAAGRKKVRPQTLGHQTTTTCIAVVGNLFLWEQRRKRKEGTK